MPAVMGIVNVTPDSFSDGGRFLDPGRAADQVLALVEQGADLVDLGGESTRPYSKSIAAAEELGRIIPVLERLAGRVAVPLSIDTSKAAVAREAVSAGVEIINDVSAGTADPGMLDAMAECRAGICAMHMQGTPQTMQDRPEYHDVVADVERYLGARRDTLVARGIDAERICLDPGIGFGKTTAHNLALLRDVGNMHRLGSPVLVGFSRKGFIGSVLGDPSVDREAGGIGVAIAAAVQGVQVVRVHRVDLVRQAFRLFEACGGEGAGPWGREPPGDAGTSDRANARECD